MVYIKAADIIIQADGFDDPYFKKRTAEYITDECDPDLKVRAVLSDNIEIPDAEVVASRGARHFFKTENVYGFYDVMFGRCIALITADKEWKNVTGQLVDISDVIDIEHEVRRFNMVGEIFRYHILFHGGIIYHSSTLAYQGNGLMFSAASGTGKSTHTKMWLECFPEAEIINDDSPALRLIDGKVWVYGTPWSGTSGINKNVKVPLKALVYLKRGDENIAGRLGCDKALEHLIGGLMMLPVFDELLDKTLDNLSAMADFMPLYKLNCNISHEAVYAIKNKIFE